MLVAFNKENACSEEIIKSVGAERKKGAAGCTSVGGLARDEHGEWLLGYCRSTGESSGVQAELRAIYDDLSPMEQGRINEPLNRSWEVRLCHVYREANAAEDLAVPTILQQDLSGTASLRFSLHAKYISQSPLEIAGVNHIDFWHMVRNARREKLGEPELGPLEFYAYIYPKLDLVNMKTDFLNRNGNSYVHFLYFANKKNANIDYFILRVQPHLKLLVVEGEETL
ncbi:hypothetical protein GOBAR_AA17320 [Gossypium barbadense]|uniref:Uncharacterized protein n=1 Tax=Gossypium barbadense TaxID=3634 RepID=A0A2P5XJ28_GOSBA|nr:hypothetical protein GOBAR_AA17320 [Gossypium barbadense]